MKSVEDAMQQRPELARSESTRDPTSEHLRRAIAGDLQSLEWLVLRVSPLLRMQASYRLGSALRAICDPDDLVQEAWLVALPRLATLQPVGERYTPALLRFLGSILLHLALNLTRKHLRGDAPYAALPPREGPEPTAAQSGVVTHAVRRELELLVAAALGELEPLDREILVLRGIEQQRNQIVSTLLGISPQAVSMRFQRALARLRERLPNSVFDELVEPDGGADPAKP
jgi:RNA polymerase sigma factor (sigma-70 family)